MAKIIFYEATQMDIAQLSEGLKDTDHYWEFKSEPANLDNLDSNAEVISVFIGSTLSKEVLAKMPRLRLIATRSTGFDHIDVDYASSRDITVVNVPSYGENTVAEHVFALLLALSRKLLPTTEAARDGTYRADRLVGFDLKDRTMGIIGMGHIGQNTAKIARGFGMKVISYDVKQIPELAEEIGFSYTSLNDVIMHCDVLTLHTPLTAENFHLINQGSISRMKPGAILINTARGELVESRALIEALQKKQLAGAGLDTIEGEEFLHNEADIEAILGNATSPDNYLRMAETDALLRLPNVVITPHSAYNTTEAISRINNATTENIIKFWYGETPNKVKTTRKIGQLIIIRHGESEWNALDKWTGTTDVHISSEGVQDSAKLGEKIADIHIDYAFISEQIRSRETLEAIMNGSKQLAIHSESSSALNERDYGVYTGMNKNKILDTIGQTAFDELRRSWDTPVEGGESLKDVYERAVPFYLRIILPRLRHGQNVLVVAHGNSIRSLIKYIENISDEEIGKVEMIQDTALVYEVDFAGRSVNRQTINSA